MALKEHVLTIANGQTDSNIVNLEGRSLIRSIVPDCTGTLTLYIGREDASMLAAKTNDGSAIAFPDNGCYNFNPIVPGLLKVQVKSGSAEAAARTIYIYSEDYST